MYNVAKTFYIEHKMLEQINQCSIPAYNYLVGPEGVEANKWRSTEWLRNETLPPRYGIISRQPVRIIPTQCMKMHISYHGYIVLTTF
jgi:hypothetical protein